MKNNCFTILCWFLPNINMNQPYVYICSLPLEPSSNLPPHPTLLACHRALVWVPWVIQQTPIGKLLHTWWCICSHAPLPIWTTPSSPYTVSTSLRSLSVSPLLPANRFISTIFLDSRLCFNIRYLFFSFWPTSLCVTSTSLELTPQFLDSSFFLWLGSIPQLLYPFIHWWTARLLPIPSYCK